MSLKSMLSFAIVASVTTLSFAQTDKCRLSPVTYECSTHPVLVVNFDKVNLSKCGSFYDKSLFLKLKDVAYTSADATKNYTVAMIDPDAPRHEKGQAYLHWLRTGVQGSDLVNRVLTTGHTVTDYAPPTPPNGTGVHRYLFYLYQETENTNATVESITKRGKFDLDEYAKQHALCGPIAVNMFSTQY